MRRLLAVLLMLSGLGISQTPPGASIVVGRILALRNPASGGTLRFASDGTLTKGEKSDLWSDTALVHITKVEAKPDRIVLSGKRCGLGVNEAKRLAAVPSDTSVKIEVIGPAPDRTIAAVFFPVNATLADVAPLHWQLCARGEVTKNKKDGIVCKLGAQERQAEAQRDVKPGPFAITVFVDQGQDRIPRYAAAERMVYRVVPKTVVPPKAIHTPDTHYIMNSVNAIAVFDALLEGKPVPVKISVEMNWSLSPR